MNISIVDESNFELVLPLIADYQQFYKMVPDVEKNRVFFKRFVQGRSEGVLFIALESGKPVGFATLYFPFSSLLAAQACVLYDLYSIPEMRGRGVGKALMEHSLGYAKSLAFQHMEWQTEVSNSAAQRLYDRSSASRTSWYGYQLSTDLESKSLRRPDCPC